VAALGRAIAVFEEHGHGELRVTARNSMILEFEICFGQCRPTLERCLVESGMSDAASVDGMNYAALIRAANERGFMKTTWQEWVHFRDARNRTAHAYSEPMAEEIAAQIPQFVMAASELLSKLQEKEAEA
jgi:hypothetical protein